MKQNIVIIGGGTAGLEAAAQLLQLGYSPTIIEKSDRLGGHVASWHRLFPDMAKASDVTGSLLKRTEKAGIMLNTGIQYINRLKDGYNVMLDNGHQINARAVLVASGFQLFDASKKEEYGYGIYGNVITNGDLEAWFEKGGDGRVPDKPSRIGFVHCVGSRDAKAGNNQCSKVCCMTAIKQAMEMKKRFPLAEVYCFYMDLRLFGRKYEDYYLSAQKDYGIHFIRGRVSEVGETVDGRLQMKAEDTLNGKPLKMTLDLLVLMAGMACNRTADELARMLRLDIDTDGFLQSRDNICRIIESGRPGIFLAGACTGAKTIPETVAEARAAALAIHNYLRGQQ